MNTNAPLIEYGSVCSGIEAASVAWEPLGFKPAWFSEIAPFANAVLAHHYPLVPNLGDMIGIAAQVRNGSVRAPDVLVGGTPCQAFSIAGMRQGLADPRGALTLKYTELANVIDEVRAQQDKAPAVLVWENVPGVLNDRANAFGNFLGALCGEGRELHPSGQRWSDAGCVYGPKRSVAWRILDAQYFGLAQRRKRVFVVASARGGFDPAEVLLECDGVRRDSPPSRQALERLTRAATRGAVGTSRNADPEADTTKSGCVTLCFGGGNTSGPIDPAACLTARGHKCDFCVETFAVQAMCGSISHPLTCSHGVTEDGNGRGETIIAVSHRWASRAQFVQGVSGDISHTLNTANNGKGCSEDGTGRGTPVVAVAYRVDGEDLPVGIAPFAVAFAENSRGEVRLEGGTGQLVGALSTGGGKPGQGSPVIASLFPARHRRGRLESAADVARVACPTFEVHLQITPASGDHRLMADGLNWSVRRLMPVECERLQGLPDNYTLVDFRGAPAADGPRYTAIGNSMAVHCMAWIGQRLRHVMHR